MASFGQVVNGELEDVRRAILNKVVEVGKVLEEHKPYGITIARGSLGAIPLFVFHHVGQKTFQRIEALVHVASTFED